MRYCKKFLNRIFKKTYVVKSGIQPEDGKVIFAEKENELSNKKFILISTNRKYLTFNPATEEFYEVDNIRDLKIWDYQTFKDPDVWFMGNTSKPKIQFTIERIVDPIPRKSGKFENG